MTPTEEFQARWGPEWAGVIGNPSFTDALLTVNVGLLDQIKRLSPEQTASPMGNIYLARLQGALEHENELIKLSILLPDISSSDLGPETYTEDFSGEEEGQNGQKEESNRLAPSEFFKPQSEQIEVPQRTKRKYRKRRKKGKSK